MVVLEHQGDMISHSLKFHCPQALPTELFVVCQYSATVCRPEHSLEEELGTWTTPKQTDTSNDFACSYSKQVSNMACQATADTQTHTNIPGKKQKTFQYFANSLWFLMSIPFPISSSQCPRCYHAPKWDTGTL